MAEALLIPQFEQDLSDYALKSYVDNAVANKDVGVTTFNGRKGAVSPQSGDYTYSMVGAASSGHGHSGTYADYSHTHNYAASNHTHSYAASNHTHDYAASNHTHTVTGTSHTHTGYASSTHSHSDYASSSHTHSGYASSTHTHSYASSSHTHSGYASSSHTHSASDITNLNSAEWKLTQGAPTDTTKTVLGFINPKSSGLTKAILFGIATYKFISTERGSNWVMARIGVITGQTPNDAAPVNDEVGTWIWYMYLN